MKMSLSTFLLRLFLGAFLIILGLYGILADVDESIFSLSNASHSLEVIFGLIELGCGLFLLASCFIRLSESVTRSASLVVLIFWLLRILLSRLVWGIDYSNGIVFRGSFTYWLLALSIELLVGAALYKVNSSVRD